VRGSVEFTGSRRVKKAEYAISVEVTPLTFNTT
jgi:hypothetical protein